MADAVAFGFEVTNGRGLGAMTLGAVFVLLALFSSRVRAERAPMVLAAIGLLVLGAALMTIESGSH